MQGLGCVSRKEEVGRWTIRQKVDASAVRSERKVGQFVAYVSESSSLVTRSANNYESDLESRARVSLKSRVMQVTYKQPCE